MEKTKFCVIIDAGHCKSTPGKKSPDKRLYEWIFNRDIAKKLKKLLDAEGIAYYDIHPEDDFIKGYMNDSKDLGLRVRRANEKYASLKKEGKKCVYVSIHSNAAGSDGKWSSASGFSAYVSDNASENSKKIGRMFQEEAEKLGLKGNRSVPKEKYHKANFYVIKNTNMPAVLTENLFYTNKEETDFLLSEEGQNIIAKMHFDVIKRYIESL